MAKRATPKQQLANGRSRRRYAAFEKKVQKRLLGATALSKCGQCGEAKLSHAACLSCGYYKGRMVIDKSKDIDKITKVKA